MKTAFILLLVFAATILTYSQDYISFPIENAHWNVYLETTCENDSPPDTLLLSYTLNGDTTINETAYKKVYLEKFYGGDSLLEYAGALREDGKKIYFIGIGYLGSDSSEEYLLYDFTKQIGEFIHHDSKATFTSKILEIDSIQVGDQFRKRYEVESGWGYHNPDYIIEGIGSVNNGLLGHVSDIPTCGTHFWEHICFEDQDQKIELINPNFISCYSKVRLKSVLEFAPIGAKWYYSNAKVLLVALNKVIF